MKLFLMRHGEASFAANSDIERPLTERGRAQTESVIRENLTQFRNIKQIIASPYLRAQQTAAIVASTLGLEVVTMPMITPDSAPERACQSLFDATKGKGEVMVVTHMPFVGGLTSLLVSGDLRSPESFLTSQVSILEGDELLPGCMTQIKVCVAAS